MGNKKSRSKKRLKVDQCEQRFQDYYHHLTTQGNRQKSRVEVQYDKARFSAEEISVKVLKCDK